MRTLYCTDGTPEGFYTAVFDGWKCENAYIFSTPTLQTALGDVWLDVATNNEKARRVIKKLSLVDRRSLFELDCILRTQNPEREQIAFEYLRLIIQTNAPSRERLTEKSVRRAIDLSKTVTAETHRLKGFLRFQETLGGAFYAPCAPDNDVVDLLMPHFVARFKTVPFVIHDTKRKLAGIYDGNDWLTAPTPKGAEIVLTEREDGFSGLWKKYYDTVAISARTNERQMKAYMPVRYWKFMTEKE